MKSLFVHGSESHFPQGTPSHLDATGPAATPPRPRPSLSYPCHLARPQVVVESGTSVESRGRARRGGSEGRGGVRGDRRRKKDTLDKKFFSNIIKKYADVVVDGPRTLK